VKSRAQHEVRSNPPWVGCSLKGMRLPHLIALAVLFAVPQPVGAQSVAPPRLSGADRVRLAEARRLIAAVGDSVWLGWSAAPSAVLLVTPEREFLLWHARPSADFERIGHDSLLASDVYSRPRRFPPTLLATFPAVGGVPTIVIGTAEQTGKRSTAWVLTIAHEHFHQWQNSQPEYYARAAALDLAGGDTTGMWMLSYPFPYTAPAVNAEFDAVALALRAALRDSATVNRDRHTMAIDGARRGLRAALGAPDLRYLDFQLWQEGIARYTEYVVARLAATRYQPSDAFRALPDAEPFGLVADRLWREIVETESVSLTNQRVAFYPVGAALGLWLDRSDPAWRRRYIERMFSLDPPTSPPR
jgi:hypothetical protein